MLFMQIISQKNSSIKMQKMAAFLKKQTSWQTQNVMGKIVIVLSWRVCIRHPAC